MKFSERRSLLEALARSVRNRFHRQSHRRAIRPSFVNFMVFEYTANADDRKPAFVTLSAAIRHGTSKTKGNQMADRPGKLNAPTRPVISRRKTNTTPKAEGTAHCVHFCWQACGLRAASSLDLQDLGQCDQNSIGSSQPTTAPHPPPQDTDTTVCQALPACICEIGYITARS